MTASQTADELHPGISGPTWQVLTNQVESFIAAWEAGREPPRLDTFAPAGPPPLRRLVLLELVKVDLEYRWQQRREPRLVEQYLKDHPELASAGVPCDLLYEEFHVRRQAGDPVGPEEYFRRFPDRAQELGRLLGADTPHLSTALCQTPRSEPVQVGDRLDDFDLLAPLGQGAFASVFLARQQSLQRLVALKVSAARGSEPQTLAQLDHPHIVRVYDRRVLPERGLSLMYMQYLAGGTLQGVIEHHGRVPAGQRSGRTMLEAVDRALERRGETPPADSSLRERLADLTWPEVVCWLGIRLASALEYAHGHGVLHRDVKPANVLLTAEGAPRLADFNVSFCSKLEGATPSAFFGGSLAYMAPEHLESFNPAHPRSPDSLDGRSDLFSLGVLLWELLTGRRPFPDEPLASGWLTTLERLTARRRAGVAQEDGRLPPGCPAGLEQVLRSCLEPDPERRPPSGRELAQQLHLCLQPKAWHLLSPPAGGWRRLALRFPVLCLLLAGLLPNALAGYFNFAYNAQAIIPYLRDSERVFFVVQLAVNATAFPLGMALFVLLAWPVGRAVRRVRSGGCPDGLPRLRQRCLRLGHSGAGICIAGWLLAGVAYPVSIQAAMGTVPVSAFGHFLASLALCGLLAIGHTFFGIAFLGVRVIYPVLLRAGANGAWDLPELQRLSRVTRLFLLLAASVPMLAVMALVLIGSQEPFVLGVLSVGGLAGFGLAFWLAQSIHEDLQALAGVLSPGEEVVKGDGDSFSSWARLRT